MHTLLTLWIGLLSLAGSAWAANEERLRLFPFPKEVRLQPGQFALKKPLVLEISPARRGVIPALLNEELHRAGLPLARVRELDSANPAFRLATGPGPLEIPPSPTEGAPEGYALEVRGGEIVCSA